MLTQSCGGIQYIRFPLLNIYVNKHKEHSLVGCALHAQRNLCSEGLVLCLSWQWGALWCACFFMKKPLNNPFECYCSVSSIHADELCNSMRIGRLYRVVGFPAHVHQWQSISWSVEANNVQPWEPECKPVNGLILVLLQIYRNSSRRCAHTYTKINPWPLTIF